MKSLCALFKFCHSVLPSSSPRLVLSHPALTQPLLWTLIGLSGVRCWWEQHRQIPTAAGGGLSLRGGKREMKPQDPRD